MNAMFPLLCLAFALLPANLPADTCLNCHGNPLERAADTALNDCFQLWLDSPHSLAGLSCVHCHGGDPEADEMNLAHQPPGEEEMLWSTRSQRINATCGGCHEEIFLAFEESEHNRFIKNKGQEADRPTCITCHGGMTAGRIPSSEVAALCLPCHAREEGQTESLPEKAERLLKRMELVGRLQKLIALKGSDGQCKQLCSRLVPRINQLLQDWHQLELEKVDAQSEALLVQLTAMRDELR